MVIGDLDHLEVEGLAREEEDREGKLKGGRQKYSRPAKSAKSSEDFTNGDSARKDSFPLWAISIKLKENVNIVQDEFCPLREPGIYLPEMDISALSLFELFFDETILQRLLDCTLEYAESKKRIKRYRLFMRQKMTISELKAYIGTLLLLGAHNLHNHHKAWSMAKAQVLVRLHDLFTCQRFELIGTFLHIVTK